MKEFQDIHPDFFGNLNQLSGNWLTPLDLKYCVCIYLNMLTKEIAAAYKAESKSVRMSKYCIKQKLNLTQDIDLGEFSKNLVGTLEEK